VLFQVGRRTKECPRSKIAGTHPDITTNRYKMKEELPDEKP
jgi:hypothetical protein